MSLVFFHFVLVRIQPLTTTPLGLILIFLALSTLPLLLLLGFLNTRFLGSGWWDVYYSLLVLGSVGRWLGSMAHEILWSHLCVLLHNIEPIFVVFPIRIYVLIVVVVNPSLFIMLDIHHIILVVLILVLTVTPAILMHIYGSKARSKSC